MKVVPPFFSFLIIAACGSGACTADIKAPESIAGATINLNGELYYPSNITIERYEPQKNTARMIMRYSKQLMPRISEAAALTGAATTEGVHGEKVKPSIITFTGQKGRVYSGTISGSFYCSSFYRGEEDEKITILKNEKIEFILPDDDRPVAGIINGPEKLGKGVVLQITTDKRSLICTIGSNCELSHYFLKYPDEKEAGIGLDLPREPGKPDVFLHLSASDTFEEAITIFSSEPYIVFTEKLLDKIYKGAFFGYLYGYTKDRLMSCWTLKFKEKLLSITIILPS